MGRREGWVPCLGSGQGRVSQRNARAPSGRTDFAAKSF